MQIYIYHRVELYNKSLEKWENIMEVPVEFINSDRFPKFITDARETLEGSIRLVKVTEMVEVVLEDPIT